MLAVSERRVRDAFPYLETEAQWAAYTIRDARKKACDRVRASYPPDQQKALLDGWRDEGDAPDGADVVALLGARRGWIARLERDLSGVASVDVQGERATVVTGRGTRYAFRRRENGIWGLTLFTAELAAEAERASRDLEVVEQAAHDYDSARAAATLRTRRRGLRRARPSRPPCFAGRPTSGPAGAPSSRGRPARTHPGSTT